MKVLVTGSSGFIGRRVVAALERWGHIVFGLDRREFLEGVTPATTAMAADLRSAQARAGIDAVRPEVVVHCAAYADLRHNWDSEQERERQLQDNVFATWHLLEAIPLTCRVVFLSTAAVYGALGGQLNGATEYDANPGTIESVYAATKLAGEAMVTAYAHARDVPAHILRLVNVVGPGYAHGVIADFVRMAKDGHIHARDDGRQTKPWVHVDDVVEFVHECVERDIEPDTYNVASQELISWWDVVDAMGVPRSDVTHEPTHRGHVGDPYNLRVTTGRSANAGFVCKRSVKDGIREALDGLGWTGGRRAA